MINIKDKKLRKPLRLLISLLIIGMLFKIIHWPYSSILIISAFSGIAVLYPIRFKNKTNKALLDYIKLVLVISWVLNSLFTLYHLPYGLLFKIITPIAFISWFAMEGLYYFSANGLKPIPLKYYGIYVITGLLLLLGLAFKIMHWPYSTLLLILGFSLSVISIIITPFNKQN